MTTILATFIVSILLGVWLLIWISPRLSRGWKGLLDLFVILEIGLILLLCFIVFVFRGGTGVFKGEVQDTWSGGKKQQLELIRGVVSEDTDTFDEERGYAICLSTDDFYATAGGSGHYVRLAKTSDDALLKLSLPLTPQPDWNWRKEDGYLYLKPGDEVVVGASFKPTFDRDGKVSLLSSMGDDVVFRGTPQEFYDSKLRRDGLKRYYLYLAVLLVGVAGSILLARLLYTSNRSNPTNSTAPNS